MWLVTAAASGGKHIKQHVMIMQLAMLARNLVINLLALVAPRHGM